MELKLDTSSWKEFKVSKLFTEVERGKRLTKINRIAGKIPFVTAGYLNQGIAEYIGNSEQKIYKDAITIDMFCNCFYRSYQFCCDDNILVLSNNYPRNVNLFIASVIFKDKYKYQYGRQYRKSDFMQHVIKLPIDSNNLPDWQYMNDYIEALITKNKPSIIKNLFG